MGRRGEFYDQDAEPPPPERPGRRRFGAFYDQDEAGPEPAGRPALSESDLDFALPPRPPLRISSRTAPVWDPGDPASGSVPAVGDGWGPPVRPAPDPVPPPSRTSPQPAPGRRPGRALERLEALGREASSPGPALPHPAPRRARPAAPPRAARPAASRPARAAADDRSEPVPSTGRATAVLAAGTFASRVTGFLRVLAIGYVLGVGSLSDAFNYANGIPNIVYDLLLGGILSATLVPVFVEQLSGDREEGSRAVSAILTAIAAALVVISGLLWLIAPAVIHFYLLLNHSASGPAERDLATRLLRWFTPQVFFLGTIVASTALLNARRRFTVAALSPVVNNLVAIAALLATKFIARSILTGRNQSPATVLDRFSHDNRAVVILGAGTTLGYAVQLLIQLPAMRRTGLRLRPVWEPGHRAVRRVAVLSSWLVGVVLANQASLALVMVLAGGTQGGVTAYQFAYQFFQLPYALIAVSVASAIMPDLAERWTADDTMGFERQLVTGLRVSLAVLVPVAVVYMAVAQPFIQVAIRHGRVSGSGAHLIGSTLVYFAVGLPGFAAFFLLMRAFQAMQDARTMFTIYVLENAMTIVAAVALKPVLGVPGLALAWSAPYTVAAGYAAFRLRRPVGNLGGWLTVRALMRIGFATAVTAAVVVGVGLLFPGRSSEPVLLGRLVVQSGAGAVAYLYLARALGIRELRPVLAMVRRVAGRG